MSYHDSIDFIQNAVGNHFLLTESSVFPAIMSIHIQPHLHMRISQFQFERTSDASYPRSVHNRTICCSFSSSECSVLCLTYVLTSNTHVYSIFLSEQIICVNFQRLLTTVNVFLLQIISVAFCVKAQIIPDGAELLEGIVHQPPYLHAVFAIPRFLTHRRIVCSFKSPPHSLDVKQFSCLCNILCAI